MVNAKELREAAKCILNMDCECDSYHGYRCGKCNTLAPFARHILATIRDDDDEPVTIDWVEKFNINEITIGMKQMHYLPHDMLIGYHAKTRRQFRQLCEGLGITLKETK